MESIIIKKQIAQQKTIERLQLQQAYANPISISFNQPASLTLTRINTLAVLTTGTTVTWESEIRNSGFTWSGTSITIPASGYYTIQCTVLINISVGLSMQRVVNGVTVGVIYPNAPAGQYFLGRSEERRVGKECISRRSRYL